MRLHLVGNSHIDPVWLWDKYEGIDEVLNTFRSACDRLDEFPELCFSASSLQFYQWCLDYDRGLFDRIREHVEGGRWEITGGWWIEPDSNLPLEASVKKQHAVSQRFMDHHFGGLTTDVAFLPDTFGHPASLPKLLAETGQKYFVFCRPGAHEKDDLPGNLFYWEYGGHRVLAYRLKHHYTQSKSTDESIVFERLSDPEYDEQSVNGFLFGVGNHGGGPTVAEIELYRKYIVGRPKNDAGFSTCAAFFAEAEKTQDIPTYSGDLHRHAVGCYSVMRGLKQQIRSSEHGLGFAERAMQQVDGSTDSLAPLWHKTLFNQFHDIMPGSCSPAAADMARAEMGGVDDGWRTLAYESLKSLSANRPVTCEEGEFRIFNTLPYEVRAPLSVESFQYFVPDAEFRDAQGSQIEIQEATPSVRCNNRRWVFVDTLPARGFKTYAFHNEGPKQPRGFSTAHFVEGDQIASNAFAVAGSGTVTRADGNPLLPDPRFLVLNDASDTWGHGVVRYNDVIGAFSLVSAAVCTGPVVEQAFQKWTFERSHIDAVYTLYRDLSWIDLDLAINWAEDRRILKMEISPEGYGEDVYTVQGPGGSIDRPADGSEQPLHHWVGLRGGDGAFGVVQDGAFACDCSGGRLRINLVRSSIYGYHDPNVLDPLDPQQLTDQGLHHFRFRYFFDRELDPTRMNCRVETMLEPFMVIRESGSPSTPNR